MEALTVGKYQLLDRIGSGGMAEVHLARVVGAAGFEKLVVVKRLLPALAEEKDYVAQFIDEARLAATFSHANIVSTFDFGEADGSYFIAMEYVEGKNLRRIQDVLERRGKKLPAPAAIHIVAEACRGLDYAHARKDSAGNPLKVVHRDVSPQNIVVSYSGDVKVLDFGIAKSSAREFKTQAGIVKGKLRYMSPEQVAGEEIDGRSDLFAAAVILWELFFGKRWMPDMPDEQLVHWVKKGEFVLPPTAPKPPDDLKAILDKALAVDKNERYATCGDFAKALARYNSQRWPDFSATDLSRLLDTEFGEDMRKERAWIAGILGGLAEKAAARVDVKVQPNPGLLPPMDRPNEEVPTIQTPSGGTGSASVASKDLPLVVGNVGTGGARTPKPSNSRAIVAGLGQAPAVPEPSGVHRDPLVSSVSVEPSTALPAAAPKRRFAGILLGVGALALLAVGALVARYVPFGATATPTPIAKASTAPSATPAASATLAASTSTPPATATPAATQTAVAIATPTIRAATPMRTPTPVVVAHTPTPHHTPAPTPTQVAVATPIANPARVSVSVPLPGWAEVWIDNRRVSPETPLINYAIAAGPHEIAVVKNGKKSSQNVRLSPGERRTIVLPLPQ